VSRCAAAAADYVDEHGELLDEIILPQGATGGKDDPSRGSAGGARRGSKSAGADGMGLHGMDQDMINQATFAALMQQGAWQVGACTCCLRLHGSRCLVAAAKLHWFLHCRALCAGHVALRQDSSRSSAPGTWDGAGVSMLFCTALTAPLLACYMTCAGHVALRQDSSRSSPPGT
jgi:hypothetical protein